MKIRIAYPQIENMWHLSEYGLTRSVYFSVPSINQQCHLYSQLDRIPLCMDYIFIRWKIFTLFLFPDCCTQSGKGHGWARFLCIVKFFGSLWRSGRGGSYRGPSFSFLRTSPLTPEWRQQLTVYRQWLTARFPYLHQSLLAASLIWASLTVVRWNFKVVLTCPSWVLRRLGT